MRGVILENGLYGRRAVLHTAWSPPMLEYLLSQNVVELELNVGKGWRTGDLAFLTALPQLVWLRLFDPRAVSDVAIHSLRALRVLELTTYCRNALDFSVFPELAECALEWRPGAESILARSTLRTLFTNRYRGTSVEPFSNLINLESLAILNAPLNTLAGVGALRKLKVLRLANLRRLTSLAGIEVLDKLEELDVNTCRGIHAIEQIGYLPRLRNLQLNNCGDIESLRPLDQLHNLENIGLVESTNVVDGDLSPLIRQRALTRVAFRNRKHYSHRREIWNPLPRSDGA